MTRTRYILSLAFALLAAALLPAATPSPLAAQQPPEFEEEVAVTEVLLDVLVTDGRGNPVLGLDADDFIVEEDGEAVDVRSATFYTTSTFLESAGQVAPADVDTAGVSTERYFVLFFHDQRDLLPRLTAQILDAGRRAKQWAKTELGPGDWVAVVAYDRKLKIFQDFTDDPDQIGDAIDKAVRGGAQPDYQATARRGTGQAPSLVDFLPSPAQVSQGSERFYGAMEILAQATGNIPARKNVVLFSLGFGEIHEFGFYTPDSRYYEPMIHALDDNNVAVYSIDLIAIDPGEPLIDNVHGNSLSSLSADTTGEYYFNFVNFLTPLERMARDNQGYYLLSYPARHPEDGSGFQEVTVRTENPDFRVEARSGYQWGER